MAIQGLVGASPLPRKTNQKKKKEKWQTRVLLVPPPFPPDTHSTDPHPPICIQSKTTSILIHVLTRAYPSASPSLLFHLPISSSSRAIFISVYHRASHSAASKNLFIMLRYYFSQTPTMSKEKRKCRRTFLTYFILFILTPRIRYSSYSCSSVTEKPG